MALTTLRRRKASTSQLDAGADAGTGPPVAPPAGGPVLPEGCIPIGEVAWRQAVRFVGRVRSMRVQPWADVATLECTLVDETGGITVVFLGRRKVPGVALGRSMIVEGMAGEHHGRLALLNPDYTLLASTL